MLPASAKKANYEGGGVSGRTITVTLRGGKHLVRYHEPAGTVYEPSWGFIGIRPRNLTDRELRSIDAACLADLVARRAAWRQQLQTRTAGVK